MTYYVMRTRLLAFETKELAEEEAKKAIEYSSADSLLVVEAVSKVTKNGVEQCQKSSES